MSYSSQALMADDPYLKVRVAQCAAQEGCATEAGIDPDLWTYEWRRVWASSPGWDVAWESALAADIPNPGADAGVITDGMILTQVQAMKPFARVGASA